MKTYSVSLASRPKDVSGEKFTTQWLNKVLRYSKLKYKAKDYDYNQQGHRGVMTRRGEG